MGGSLEEAAEKKRQKLRHYKKETRDILVYTNISWQLQLSCHVTTNLNTRYPYYYESNFNSYLLDTTVMIFQIKNKNS